MTTSPNTSETEEASLAALCVRSLLERRGLPRHKHSPVIAEVLGLSYSQAHRKVTGASPWTLEELARVAEHFGEPLGEMVEAGTADSAQPAKLIIGQTRIACRVWLGDPVDPAHAPQLVAIGGPGEWVVVPLSETGSVPARAVRRVVVQPAAEQPKRVAVIDDQRDVADSLAEQLASAGFETTAFYSAEDVIVAGKPQRFDAYVIDWVLANGTARTLIASIRAQDSRCPIVVFTGQLESRLADEKEVAEALQSYRLLFHEKPVRAVIIAADLSRAMAAQ